MTLLSALMIAACGNGEAGATAAPTTEATAATQLQQPVTTAGASETKKYHLQILNVSDH